MALLLAEAAADAARLRRPRTHMTAVGVAPSTVTREMAVLASPHLSTMRRTPLRQGLATDARFARRRGCVINLVLGSRHHVGATSAVLSFAAAHGADRVPISLVVPGDADHRQRTLSARGAVVEDAPPG